MDYAQQLPMNNMSGDMQSVEQTLNMSPMDLFDSIFWGKSFIFTFISCCYSSIDSSISLHASCSFNHVFRSKATYTDIPQNPTLRMASKQALILPEHHFTRKHPFKEYNLY